MSTHKQLSDAELFERYLGQPARLPEELRRAVEAAWGGEAVLAYAFSDLDSELRFQASWLVLGERHAAVITQSKGQPKIAGFSRAQIRSVSNQPGLSCRVLRLHGEGMEPPLAELYFTHRQKRGMESVAFVIEQALEGRSVPVPDADALYARSLLDPVRAAQALVTPHKLAVVWRLLGYLRPYRKSVALGTGAAFGITALSMAPPFIIGKLVDRVIGPVQAGKVPPAAMSTIAWLAVGGIALVYLLRQVCVSLRLRLMAELGELVAGDLRDELYDHLHTLSMSFFSRKKTGSLITRVSSDTDRLWEFLAFGVVEVSLAVVMLTGLGAILVALDWRLGLVIMLPVPLFCFAIYKNGEHMETRFLRAWRKWSRLTDILSDTIPGMRVVKAFNQERRERTRFHARNADVVGEFNGIHREWSRFWPRLLFGIQLAIIVVWCAAMPRLLQDATFLGPKLSMGTFMSFLLYMTMFVQPIETVGQVQRILHRATTSAHRVFEVLDTEPEVRDPPDAVRLSNLTGLLEFRDVSFSYDGVRQVIRGVSFQVRPGELIGLVGPSGGGKTTLVNLITRFYDVGGGEILVDGLDVRALDSGAYRSQVGIVLQDPYLFHGSILDNIRYGLESATLEDVIRAARAANAHDFVCELALGYDTIVGERGQTLSGGERQRISIARAILRNPRILILDEATSSVDAEAEAKIQQALDRLVAGRTVFAIAHRLSTLRRASRLLVIEKGKLVEAGSHAELLSRPNGLYRRLFTLQQELHHAA